MVDEPLGKLDAYVDAGARILTVHVEATRDPRCPLQNLADRCVVRGAALNPATPSETVAQLLDELELLLVLAVSHGCSGGRFSPARPGRLAAARDLIARRDIVLGVDGGVRRENIDHASRAGFDRGGQRRLRRRCRDRERTPHAGGEHDCAESESPNKLALAAAKQGRTYG